MREQTVNFVVERYDNEELAEANEQLGMIVARLHIENVKLRELVCDLYEAYEGEVNDCWLVEFRERMRELGIEVDK